MKKFIFFSMCVLALLGCKQVIIKVVPTIISVTTTPPVVTSTTVAISGNISDDGGDPITDRGVVYSLTNQNPTLLDSKVSSGAGTGSFNGTITGLSPGKTYYIRFYATNSIGTAYGDLITINTDKIAPSITPGATNPTITSTTATISGNITADGGGSITDRGVVFGLNPNPTITDGKVSSGTGTGSYTTTITGLTPGKTYYFRTYAINSAGTTYGDQITLLTPALAPAVTTTTPTAVTSITATSGGNVTSDGGAAITARGVCWGTTTGPQITGNKTTESLGTGTGAFTSSIAGLTANTTYYVRAYATNSAGTNYGNEFSFKTLANAPTITTNAASVVTTSSISIGGNVTSDGGATITAKGVCWGISTGPLITGNKTSEAVGTGTGAFTSNITGLVTNTTYYIRAYATNSTGTSYGNEIIATTLSQDIKNIVPDNILTIISNLGMPMYNGKTPPTLANFYKLAPNALKNSNVPNDWAQGTEFYPINFHLYNQDNTLLTIKCDYAEIGTNGGTGTGKEAFISGNGNNFSVFLKANYSAQGQTCDMVQVFSGTMTSTGIKDLYYALFMVDDHGDAGNFWIANGQGRVFFDSDGMSPVIASLSSMIFEGTKGIMATSPSIPFK